MTAAVLLQGSGTRPAPAAAPVPVVWATRSGAIGSAGCSAASCHGGARRPDRPIGRAAATLWFARDPHARAYESLGTELAKRIARHLAWRAPPTPPDRDPRCLACHSNPSTVLTADGSLDDSPQSRAARREGVGCESCHGSAERWAVPHATWSVPPVRPAVYGQHGMVWLNDLVTRARVCAGCHVGAPADPGAGLPGRDVTHDMLAAGHPRLAFEFASYTHALPQHWAEVERAHPSGTTRGPELRAQEWIAGQLVSGEFALRLLGANAADAAAGPEFARLDCYSCHRTIDPTRPPATGPPRPGIDRWHVSYPLRRFAARARFAPTLAALGDGRDKRWGELSAAGEAARELGDWLDRAGGLDGKSRDAFAALRAAGVPDPLDWDDAAQCVLALDALQGAGRAAPPPVGLPPAAFDGDLAAARKLVAFPAQHLSPAHFRGSARAGTADRLRQLFVQIPP